ncbi:MULTISPECIES: DUF2461 domain-containing protein [Galbibacter]|uniref:DUF2461 domain-containing protein n=1 Tax=Galbibacter pacificus TaxID=2996052 RepID=A0ABT6FR94_9FLAO|nr:DUF2461 domain-containing protein [Galbibacter pacificus]MDG3581947.1 DUF2461 domain-containing protein [Galbibacter pacificus]MDG3585579.1 DUF2461 domain-containing protein [Galbibacter pacificus]
MSITHISPSVYNFLNKLKDNNNRDWFNEHKETFKKEQQEVKAFYQALMEKLRLHDDIEDMKMFRIYRDVRFSANKQPYKEHFSGSFKRTKPRLRGGYYLHIEPGNTFLACGFWAPEKEDLLRIRKEFELDDDEIREILSEKKFRDTFGQLKGEELKTAPKGFDREHTAIDLIRKKQYVVTKKFTDKEATSSGFIDTVDESFKAIRPFFDYMSDVLTTDLNGVSLID